LANKFATAVFLFSFPRLFMMIRLSVREGRGKLDRTNSAKASFVPATGCCRSRLSLGDQLLIHATACAALVRKEKRLDRE